MTSLASWSVRHVGGESTGAEGRVAACFSPEAECELVEHTSEDHRTPVGTVQQFIYCYCRVF